MVTVLINIKKDYDYGGFQVTQNIDGKVNSDRTYYTDSEEDAVGTAIREAERIRQWGEPFFTKTAIKYIRKFEPLYSNRGQF